MTTSIDSAILSQVLGTRELSMQLEVAKLKLQQDAISQQAAGALKLIEAAVVSPTPQGNLGHRLNTWA